MRDLLLLLAQLLGVVWAFWVPGALVAFQLDAAWSRPMRLAVGLMLGVLVVPMASFCAAWLLGTNVRPPLVLATATVLSAVAAGTWALRRARRAGAAAPR